MQKSKLFGMNVNVGPYGAYVDTIVEKARLGESSYACVANVHMLIETHKNYDFAKLVNGASLVAPDGKPITWALRLVHNVRQDRVAGMDLLPDLLRLAEKRGLPVYFYGGTEAMLRQTEDYMKQSFPRLQVAGMYSPPFRALTSEEEDEIAARINASGAKLVIVVLGCPKQEKWMAAMKGRVQAYMVGLGGALPVLIGMQKRAPVWMQKTGFEWLYRLMQEPRRLLSRYVVTNSLFLLLFCKAYMQKKFTHTAS
ncbi:MAG TPA: WecB/TagA/CpsF family glycosyltransferase [Flavisolibacter sp.]|nr:WecB/TagA/CpsF family glycosyltransferase [Flavisolibacter sp.]